MAPTNLASGSCPDDELLLAYMINPESQAGEPVAAHLLQCDRCVEEMARAQSRLALAAEIPRPVPSDIRQLALATSTSARPIEASSWAESFARLRDQFAALHPVKWVPVAVAAGVLLMVTLRVPHPGAAPQTELSREVQLHQDARVTAASAALRNRPEADAAVMRSLARGDSVVLFDRTKDWYQVALPDGTRGWIEVSAFE